MKISIKCMCVLLLFAISNTAYTQDMSSAIQCLEVGEVAADTQNTELKAGIRAGHNASFGGFAAFSVEAMHSFLNEFSISAGAQYNTIGKTAIEAAPAYHIDFNWGRLSAEALLTYSNLTSVHNYTAGAGIKAIFGWLSAKLGYYYRIYGGNDSWITEPFNIYYELRANLLQRIERWDLELALTNCETFELERHYQPSYLAECLYVIGQKVAVSLGMGYKPAGTFNISADYYQTFIKTGVSFRW